MNVRPSPPVNMTGNEDLEVLFGVAVIAVMIFFIFNAIRHWVKKGSPIGLIFLIGGCVTATTEAFADFVGLLWFPIEGTLFDPLYSGFGVGVPWWVAIGYAWYFGGLPFLLYTRMENGLTKKRSAKICRLNCDS